MSKAKILVLVEGDKTDRRLMEQLLDIYGIAQNHQIVSYHTNIYTLYNEMFRDGDPEALDLLQVLREHERNPEQKKLFDDHYADILLIFDLDPQDPQFSPEKIQEMARYFTESSDMGKLYLNYPMVEAFYHMKSIPDPDYLYREVTLEELRQGLYKTRVNRENRNHNYAKFAVNKTECDMVIGQNLHKAQLLTKTAHTPPETADILNAQLHRLARESSVAVLSTCGFYILDYNPRFIDLHGNP